ncbi:MarR family transcriptional regulator [Desulfobacterota bacterium AH_259_B03_O07]|nr:MarR family transcriptional regulator [Desulfobacterota bacterium AH_259_B03_O07]
MPEKLTNIETQAWVGLVKSQQTLLDKVEAELKRHGFPPFSWYDVLLELDLKSEGRLRFNEIGKRVLISKYNVTRLLYRLEEHGLVRREACVEDGRGTYAVITKKGRDLRRRMWPVYREGVRKHFLSHFNTKELSQLVEFMRRIRNINQ